ncbi:hypothetical protein HZB03_00710 [Candidatus Woesearchaeota archaeon]|nr:hypothetical protein [Candidatus Woesearchaeota archaeon]
MASDIVEVLGELKINEIQSDPFVQFLIADGNITDVNTTVLMQIGTLWAEGKSQLAGNLTYAALYNVLVTTAGVEVFINNESLYGKNATYLAAAGSTLSVSKRMISGIKLGAPTEGFNARAFAISISKNNTLVVKGDVVSSSVKKTTGGNNLNVVTEMYDLIIPDNATIRDAWWFVEAYYIDNKFKAYINGTFLPGSGGTGSALLTNLQSYVRPGYNNLTVEYRFGSNGDEGGDDGASHFVVSYTTPDTTTIADQDTFYFSKVSSRTSIRQKKPIFVSGTVNTIDVTVNVGGSNSTLGFIYRGQWYNISKKIITGPTVSWSDAEIKAAMSSKNVSYANLSNEYFWFVLDVDDYHVRENLGAQRDILANSKIDIGMAASVDVYGYIDITRLTTNETHQTQQSGSFYRNVQWFYPFTNNSIFHKLDSQLAWLYLVSSGQPNQTVYSNNVKLYDHPPSPFIAEFARWGFTNSSGTIKTGQNNYSLSFGSGYAVDPTNSLVDYTILVKGNVPYGATFANATTAQQDAVQRLLNQLGSYVQAVQIVNTSVVQSSVPSMWGPSLFEVRVKQ